MGEIIAVTGTNGGAGATTVTVLLGGGTGERRHDVAMVDATVEGTRLPDVLDVPTGDRPVAAGDDRGDLRERRHEGPHGTSVYPASEAASWESVTPDGIARLYEELRNRHELAFVDCGAPGTPASSLWLAHADRLVIVTDGTPSEGPSRLQSTADAFDVSVAGIVCNRIGDADRVLEGQSSTGLIGILPDDEVVATSAAAGETPYRHDPDSPIADVGWRLAGLFEDGSEITSVVLPDRTEDRDALGPSNETADREPAVTASDESTEASTSDGGTTTTVNDDPAESGSDTRTGNDSGDLTGTDPDDPTELPGDSADSESSPGEAMSEADTVAATSEADTAGATSEADAAEVTSGADAIAAASEADAAEATSEQVTVVPPTGGHSTDGGHRHRGPVRGPTTDSPTDTDRSPMQDPTERGGDAAEGERPAERLSERVEALAEETLSTAGDAPSVDPEEIRTLPEEEYNTLLIELGVPGDIPSHVDLSEDAVSPQGVPEQVLPEDDPEEEETDAADGEDPPLEETTARNIQSVVESLVADTDDRLDGTDDSDDGTTESASEDEDRTESNDVTISADDIDDGGVPLSVDDLDSDANDHD